MFYFLTQLICLIIISLTTLTSSSPSKGNVETDEIDDFIGRILVSDKFNLLADKIAEKAAEKFQVLQTKSVARTGPSNDNDEQVHKEDVELLHKEDEEQLITTKNTKFLAPRRGKPGKIDMHAVMKKYASFAKEKIRLKYKDFVQSNSNEKPKAANNDFSQFKKATTAKRNIDSHHIPIRSHPKQKTVKENPGSMYNKAKPIQASYERNTNQLGKYNGVNKGKDISDSQSIEKTYLRQVEKYRNEQEEVPEEPEKTLRTKPKENSEIVEYEVEVQSEDKEMRANSNSDRDGKPNSGENNNQNSRLVRNMMTVENSSAVTEKSNLSESESDSIENKLSDINEDKVLKVDESKETITEDFNINNITVRREGGKLYTFETSPDYAEYHEKLKNSKNETNPDDLLLDL